MPKTKRHTRAEITTMLKEADALVSEGQTQNEIARSLGISVMTFHRWRKAQPHRSRPSNGNGSEPHPVAQAGAPGESNGRPLIAELIEHDQGAKMAEIQLENARLRRLVTDLLLEKMRLEDDAQLLDGRPENKVRAYSAR